MDLTETEHIKKSWQEYTEELYKKDLNDPDNHNGVITHLESDTIEHTLTTQNLGHIMLLGSECGCYKSHLCCNFTKTSFSKD